MSKHNQEEGIAEHAEWIPEDYLNVTASNPHGHNDLHVAKSIEFANEQIELVAAPIALPDQDQDEKETSVGDDPKEKEPEDSEESIGDEGEEDEPEDLPPPPSSSSDDLAVE